MTPRTKEQNEEIRSRRLAQIRKASADVFLDKGPLLEIRDVAAQAGLGYGTVYHYYSNKGDLLHDLLWDALERDGEWLKAPLDAPLEAVMKLPPEVPGASTTGRCQRAGFSAWLARTPESRRRGFPYGKPRNGRRRARPRRGSRRPVLRLWAEDHALYLRISWPVSALPRRLKRAQPAPGRLSPGGAHASCRACWKPGARRTGLRLPAETRQKRQR